MKTLIRLILIIFILSVTQGVAAQSKQSDKYFAEGIKAYNKGEYLDAIKAFSKSDELDSRDLPKTSSRLGYSKSWIAYCYHLLGDDKKAREVSKVDYDVLPVDRRLTVKSDKEADMAQAAIEAGNYPDALTHALNCLSIEEKVLGSNSLLCIGSCLKIADIYGLMRKFPEAINYCDKGLERLSCTDYYNNYYKFNLLQTRIKSNLGQGMVTFAFSDLFDLEEIAREEDRVHRDKIPTALVKILEGRIYIKANNRLTQASKLTIEAFKILQEAYTSEDEKIFLMIYECLSNLYMLAQEELMNELMLNFLTEADKIIKKEHRAMLLSWLGDCSTDKEIALNYYEQASSIFWETKSFDQYYSTQCLIAESYIFLNRIPEGFEIVDNICMHYENGEVSAEVFKKTLMTLGYLYMRLDNIDDACKIFGKVLSLFKDDKTSSEYVVTFMRFATLYFMSGNKYICLELFNNEFEFMSELGKILSTFRSKSFYEFGLGIPQIASVILPLYKAMLSNVNIVSSIPLAALEKELRGLLDDGIIPSCTIEHPLVCQAFSLLSYANYLLGEREEAISLINLAVEISENNGWDYECYLHDMAYIQHEIGDFYNAYSNFRVGYELKKRDIINNFKWMTLGERTTYANSRRGNLDNLPHYAAITPEDSRYAELGYDALLFTKGLLLNSTIELNRLLREEGDEETMALYSKWEETNVFLRKAMTEGSPNVKALKDEAERQERVLMERSKVFGDYTKGLEVTFKDVQLKLRDNDIAVEIFSYWKNAKTRHYGALVLTKQNNPVYVSIGDESEWEGYVLSEECYKSTVLFDKMFGGLKKYMPARGKGDVYFAPDGVFHTLAVESMPGAEVYNLKRLSSTRELVCSSEIHQRVDAIALFGGINYGLGEVASFYPAGNDVDRASDEFLVDLPGTKEEIEAIESIFTGKLKVDVNMQDSGSKTRLMNYSGQCPGILHLATHGFFNRDESDSMAGTGLYFAGAQNVIWDMDTKGLSDNGMITSEEISCLDFRGLNLAVLSACETGLGKINPEGVFGLQRGFKQAGAKTILMSLWKVSDEATKLLMSEFYRNLSNNKNTYDALEEAKNVVKKVYPNPKDWAGFVLLDAQNNFNI